MRLSSCLSVGLSVSLSEGCCEWLSRRVSRGSADESLLAWTGAAEAGVVRLQFRSLLTPNIDNAHSDDRAFEGVFSGKG